MLYLTSMIDEVKLTEKTYAQINDVYKIAKVLCSYCSANSSYEGINEIMPIVDLLLKYSDEAVCNLRILKDKTDPDEN